MSTSFTASNGAGTGTGQVTDKPSRNRPWTEEDDTLLRHSLGAREPASVVAEKLGRTVDAIRGRAQVLGLRIVSRVRPWRTVLPASGVQETGKRPKEP